MERAELMAMMAELSLSGMRTAYDEVMRDGLKRQRSAQQILGDLLAAEVAEKARSIRYQLGAARLPLARTLTEFGPSGNAIGGTLPPARSTRSWCATATS
jgi:hypothetical protein